MQNYRSWRPQREREIIDYLRSWVFRTARAIQAEAQHNAPRATGTLAKSIMAVLTFPTASVTVNVPYARFVEGFPQTTRRHFVTWYNKKLFEAWARRRGFKTRKRDGSVSRGGLWVWGYAVKYLERAVNKVRVWATAELYRRHI